MGLGSRIEKYFGFQQPLIWWNIIRIAIINVAMVYSFVVYIAYERKFLTAFFAWTYGMMSGLAISIGAHRLWTHKTYKAKLPLRIWMMFWYTSAGINTVVQWVRDHRSHHKYADTDADPHNAARGLFFSHCGWLMMKRHPDVKEKGKLIDVSDVMADPVVQFAEKYFTPLVILSFLIIPVAVGRCLLNESWTVCIVGIVLARYSVMLHALWLVNSWAHYDGYKPYNKNIMAANSKLAAFFAFGEGWHNFHHVFPWDYRVGEYGQGYQFGKYFIDVYAWLGLAYDLKTAPADMVKRVLEKNGNLAKNEEIPEVESNTNLIKEFDYPKECNVKNGKVKAR